MLSLLDKKGGIRWSQGANRNDVRKNTITIDDGEEDDYAIYLCEHFLFECVDLCPRPLVSCEGVST